MPNFVDAAVSIGERLSAQDVDRFIPSASIKVSPSRSFLVQKGEVKDSIQHTFASALKAYDYQANGNSDPLGSTLQDGNDLEVVEAFRDFMFRLPGPATDRKELGSEWIFAWRRRIVTG